MPLIETKGAASAQGFGEFAQSGPAIYIEDVFSTYLYTGTGATQTITNNIDLSGKGGLVWRKGRAGTYAADWHSLVDTARGASNALFSNTTNAQTSGGIAWPLTSFNSNGFTMPQGDAGGGQPAGYPLNFLGTTYASWTFRKQPKFFDVVTFTTSGTLSSNRSISHSLGSAPGFIIVKSSSNDSNWLCYHRSLGQSSYVALQSTNAQNTSNQWWTATAPTATTFNVDETLLLNTNRTYIAYLFAHDAGGFGLSGSDNVISCGSYTGNGSTGQLINLGYEPQWVLIKQTDAADQWAIIDNMRGWAQSDSATLCANTANAENADFSASGATSLDPQGFRLWNANGALNQSGGTYIYIAIRRGPMKVPTSGTSVYTPITRSGNSTATTVTGVGFAPDLVFEAARTNSGGNNWVWFDRLRGGAQILSSDNSGAEVTNSVVIQSDSLSTTMDGFRIQTANPINASGNTYVYYPLKRAPGFFDEVCITGDGTTSKAVPHNLGVVPEIVITKTRNAVGEWYTYVNALWSDSDKKGLNLRTNGAASTTTVDGSGTFPTRATASNFYIGGNSNINGETKVLYLFATCAGVSKVGSYTGTGALQTIDCGFTGGARFVLIKRTDSTGDWYVYDSARGIVAGSDPYLTLNTTAAEVTTTDWVDTYSAGFELSNAGGNNVNINGATYIFLSVA